MDLWYQGFPFGLEEIGKIITEIEKAIKSIQGIGQLFSLIEEGAAFVIETLFSISPFKLEDLAMDVGFVTDVFHRPFGTVIVFVQCL